MYGLIIQWNIVSLLDILNFNVIKSVVYWIPTIHVIFDEVGTTIKTLGPSQMDSNPSTSIIL